MIQTQNDIKIHGHVKLTIEYSDDKPDEIIEFDNLVVNSGLNLLVGSLSGVSSTLTYCAIGTSTTTALATDTQLNAEAWRGPISSFTLSNNVLVTTAYITPLQAVNVNIQEIGWFGGNASMTQNSGTLYAHATNAFGVKTSVMSVTVQRTDTLSSN